MAFGLQGADALADEHGLYPCLDRGELPADALVDVRELVGQSRALLNRLVLFDGRGDAWRVVRRRWWRRLGPKMLVAKN